MLVLQLQTKCLIGVAWCTRVTLSKQPYPLSNSYFSERDILTKKELWYSSETRNLIFSDTYYIGFFQMYVHWTIIRNFETGRFPKEIAGGKIQVKTAWKAGERGAASSGKCSCTQVCGIVAAKLGEQGGWSTSSKPQSCAAAIATGEGHSNIVMLVNQPQKWTLHSVISVDEFGYSLP